MTTFTFSTLPTGDQPSPTIAETRAALAGNPGLWTVVLRADRMARAETYAASVNDGSKFGPNFRAEIRKEGPVFRVFASHRPTTIAGVSVSFD